MRRLFVLLALFIPFLAPARDPLPTAAPSKAAADKAAPAKFPQAPDKDFVADPYAVQRCGPAYRYPQSGWIVVHIEGEPYERGFQHGMLLHREIEDYIDCLAKYRSQKDPAGGWRDLRVMVNALFLRRYEKEFLEEMKGIADGAAKAGAKFDGKPLDLLDIVTVNSGIEIDFIESNLQATPDGLEGMKFKEPEYANPKKMPMAPEDEKDDKKPGGGDKPRIRPMHCSAFAATGPATADGKIVFGHITMWNLYHVRHFNIWLDVKPTKGRRVVMQSFPGGIMSGLDYYMNDAGILVAETTIAQTKFDINGTSMVSRIRKALQYGESIDDVVKIMKEQNNGCYSNEWLIADTKTNEIAMFELGTHKSKLWRSGKKEWIGGTEGFYWGCNNAKDLEVRLETVPALDGKPANVVFRPSSRDIKWIELYEKHKGKIDEKFGFLAFTTPPIAAFPSCDAKFTTTAISKDLKSWALFGPPLGRTWEPTPEELVKFPDIKPLVSNEWALVHSGAPTRSASEGVAVDLRARKLKSEPTEDGEDEEGPPPGPYPPAWRGTLLPKTDADIWLAAAFAEYERIVALELALKKRAKDGKLSEEDREQVELAKWAYFSRWTLSIPLALEENPKGEVRKTLRNDHWYEWTASRGVYCLDLIRERMGESEFIEAMDKFGRLHAGNEASAEEFRKSLTLPKEKLDPKSPFGPASLPIDGFFNDRTDVDLWVLQRAGAVYSIYSWEKQPDKTLIVYGTTRDALSQKEAAEALQYKLRRRTGNYAIPIKADSEATGKDLVNNHLLLIGGPDANAVTAKYASKLPVKFATSSFTFRDKVYANPDSAIIAVSKPEKDHFSSNSIVCFAGLSAESTRNSVNALPNRGGPLAPVMLLEAGKKPKLMLAESPRKEEPKKEVRAPAKVEIIEGPGFSACVPPRPGFFEGLGTRWAKPSGFNEGGFNQGGFNQGGFEKEKNEEKPKDKPPAQKEFLPLEKAMDEFRSLLKKDPFVEKAIKPDGITDGDDPKAAAVVRRMLRSILGGHNKDEFEKYLQAQVAVNRFQGTVLVADGGSIIYSNGYGYANVEHEIKNAPHTKFRLASITKQFTAMGIMILEKQGKLKVDDLISKHIDDCPDAWKEITIHHLLTHTSGIFSHTSLPGFLGKNDGVPLSTKEIMDLVKDKELESKPGEKYKYSNSGYVLLGIIIEKASGKGYAEFLKQEIFEPLEMKDTGYDNSRDILKHRADGYSFNGKELVNCRFFHMHRAHAAGALYSTVTDMLKWDQALHTEKLIPKDALERMFTPDKNKYAYGWVVTEMFKRKLHGHGGGINGFRTEIFRFPEENVCIVVLTNTENMISGAVAKDLAAIVFGEKYEMPKEKEPAKEKDPAK